MEVLVTFLLGRAPRERWLMAGLVGLALPLAVVMLWVLPLLETRAAAQAEVIAARDLRQWVGQRVAQKAALDAVLPAAGAQAPAALGISGIEQSLIAAGLRDQVTRLANREGGGIELGFDAVEFRPLGDWLDQTTGTWGYDIDSFRFDATDRAGTIAASFLLQVAR